MLVEIGFCFEFFEIFVIFMECCDSFRQVIVVLGGQVWVFGCQWGIIGGFWVCDVFEIDVDVISIIDGFRYRFFVFVSFSFNFLFSQVFRVQVIVNGNVFEFRI